MSMNFREAPFFTTERGKAVIAAARDRAERYSASVAHLDAGLNERTHVVPALIQKPWQQELPSESELNMISTSTPLGLGYPFGLFNNIDRENEEWRAEARSTFAPGIDPADLKVGQKITISPNLRIHDRSYTRDIHEVVAVNASHVQTRIRDRWSKDKSWSLIMLLAHEHHFYAADGFEEGEAA